MLLLFTIMTVVTGEERNLHFQRVSHSNFSPENKVAVVQCAVSCLSKMKCPAFRVHDAVCIPLSHPCNTSKNEESCYEKDRSKSICETSQCLGRNRYRQQRTDDEAMNFRKRLLIMSMDGIGPLGEVDLQSKALNTYPGLRLTRATSLTYMPLSRRLLFCEGIPSRMISSKLDKPDKITLARVKADAIAVDEIDHYIFFVVASLQIHKMTTNGENRKVVFQDHMYHPLNLVTDVSKKQLYVSSRGKIIAVDYKGSNKRIVDIGRSIFALALDTEGRILYYNKQKYLIKDDLFKKTPKEIGNMRTLTKTFEYYEGRIYASSARRIYEIQNLSRNASITELQLKFFTRQLMCLVP